MLNSAVGAGSIAGSALTVLLVGRRLVVPIVVGFACWGLALAAIGVGSAVLPAAIGLLGVRGTLLATGGLMLAGAVAVWARLARTEVVAPFTRPSWPCSGRSPCSPPWPPRWPSASPPP